MSIKERILNKTSIWKFHKRSGLWQHQRYVTDADKENWLKIFTDDEPSEHFKLAMKKPNANPAGEGFYKKNIAHHKGLAPLAESGTITSAQMKRLKANYGVIPTMNPDSDNYKRLLGMIDKMAPDHLRQIAAADIKWLSGLAKNRINREKNTAEIAREEVQNDDVIQVYIDRINKQKIKEGIRG